jgi:hypothetical protein
MRIQTEKDREMTAVCSEIDDMLTRMKGLVQRKSSVAKLSDGRHCIRIQKFHANEKLTVGENGNAPFSAEGKTYESKIQAIAEFPDEMIVIVADLKIINNKE